MSAEYVPGVEAGTEGGKISGDTQHSHDIDVKYDVDHSKEQIGRTEILDFGNEGFLLHKLLTGAECSSIIDEGEIIGFEAIRGARDNYRSAQRINVESQSLADILWTRIQTYLEDLDISSDPHSQHIHGIPCVVEGKWVPTRLNKLFRLCRYHPGGHFAPHFDGFYEEDSKNRSMKTLMVYLNGDFTGGSTNFVDDSQTLHMDETGKYCAEDKNILCRIQPEAGMAIIFNHHRLHEGQTLGDNKKYILRTDIMYKKVSEDKIDEKEERALALIREAEELEAMGECEKAAMFLRKAFKLSPTIEDSYWA
ncbi:uncharacterized protein LOC110463519 [Mizuhopecten yessoensis]|uniref:Fe2OG dioxygenase domain-containing protein n=1 Tax=Mizuhopecten yessoensis TaxID=6573 RepID=A0A210PVY7_MIZYE|nr:uncharacterized protein LOC110463519 [Mizuhopecten yessoensis]OWF40651.1 hypothetical protein KP79_PYT09891 [Mizuhopecten yessoensis]